MFNLPDVYKKLLILQLTACLINKTDVSLKLIRIFYINYYPFGNTEAKVYHIFIKIIFYKKGVYMVLLDWNFM